ncbi:MAG TPA: tetratricopeptide repeat protein, partial [Candidatus Krumholzibacterium sp.]|nr:tetratricopeptide repeat protein [Candidatus Krumholzibacterium sp.]
MKTVNTFSTVLIVVFISSLMPAHALSGDRIEAEKYFIAAQKALAEGDDRSAENALMNALKKDPEFTSAIWQLSQIYEKRGQLEYARELILRGLKQEPDASWARDRLAQIERLLTRRLLDQAEDLMDSGKYDMAVPKLSQYLMLKPRDPIPLELLGRCHLALGNLKTAQEYLLQAVQRDPSNRDIASLLDDVERRLSRSSIDALVAGAR